jgi:positive regulator of sigma E activity
VLEPQNVLRAALIVYGYPLLGGVLAAIGAFLAGFSEIAAACAALGGLVTGIWAARIRLQDTRCLREFTPKLVDMLSTAGG